LKIETDAYLDASALVKRYSSEKGSNAVAVRFDRAEKIFTSRLSFAEVHSSLGRKFRAGELSSEDLTRVREEFESDWLFSLSVLDLDVGTISSISQLVEQYDLKAGDAIHLSAAFWLRDAIRLGRFRSGAEESIEFGVADKQLARIARKCGLHVFDPEAQN
jgi:predicted nucleic acid-binding protein